MNPGPRQIGTEDIWALDISAQDISAQDILAQDISAQDISAPDISTPDISTSEILATSKSYLFYYALYAVFRMNNNKFSSGPICLHSKHCNTEHSTIDMIY